MKTNTHKLIAVGTLALAAHGCSDLTIVGTSDAEGAPPPRAVTEIVSLGGQLLMPAERTLGDIDGDGFDDFIVSSMPAAGDLEASHSTFPETAYLFYGRPAFAETIVASDSDASFEIGEVVRYSALGDINGDGLADFVLGGREGFELVLGTKQRWTGHHAKLTTGIVVTYPEVIRPEGIARPGFEGVGSHGDVNGDGKDDLRVMVSWPNEDGVLFGISLVEYFIPGRADGWPSGKWDPSWAVAQMGDEHSDLSENEFSYDFGDIDGDGYSDLLTAGNQTIRLFYGKPEGFRGQLTPDRADAVLVFASDAAAFFLGDLDGDGADDIAVSSVSELHVVYGRPTRYEGRVQLQPDATFSNKGPYFSAAIGDLNGDGRQDFLFQANEQEGQVLDDPFAIITRPYVVYGSGKRLSGVQNDSAELYQPVGYPAPEALQAGGPSVFPFGDFDGDNSTDLVLTTGDSTSRTNTIYLLPGSPLSPD